MFVHERDTNHKFDVSNADILMTESYLRPRKFIEGVFTQFETHTQLAGCAVPPQLLGGDGRITAIFPRENILPSFCAILRNGSSP